MSDQTLEQKLQAFKNKALASQQKVAADINEVDDDTDINRADLDQLRYDFEQNKVDISDAPFEVPSPGTPYPLVRDKELVENWPVDHALPIPSDKKAVHADLLWSLRKELDDLLEVFGLADLDGTADDWLENVTSIINWISVNTDDLANLGTATPSTNGFMSASHVNRIINLENNKVIEIQDLPNGVTNLDTFVADGRYRLTSAQTATFFNGHKNQDGESTVDTYTFAEGDVLIANEASGFYGSQIIYTNNGIMYRKRTSGSYTNPLHELYLPKLRDLRSANIQNHKVITTLTDLNSLTENAVYELNFIPGSIDAANNNIPYSSDNGLLVTDRYNEDHIRQTVYTRNQGDDSFPNRYVRVFKLNVWSEWRKDNQGSPITNPRFMGTDPVNFDDLTLPGFYTGTGSGPHTANGKSLTLSGSWILSVKGSENGVSVVQTLYDVWGSTFRIGIRRKLSSNIQDFTFLDLSTLSDLMNSQLQQIFNVDTDDHANGFKKNGIYVLDTAFSSANAAYAHGWPRLEKGRIIVTDNLDGSLKQTWSSVDVRASASELTRYSKDNGVNWTIWTGCKGLLGTSTDLNTMTEPGLWEPGNLNSYNDGSGNPVNNYPMALHGFVEVIRSSSTLSRESGVPYLDPHSGMMVIQKYHVILDHIYESLGSGDNYDTLADYNVVTFTRMGRLTEELGLTDLTRWSMDPNSKPFPLEKYPTYAEIAINDIHIDINDITIPGRYLAQNILNVADIPENLSGKALITIEHNPIPTTYGVKYYVEQRIEVFKVSSSPETFKNYSKVFKRTMQRNLDFTATTSYGLWERIGLFDGDKDDPETRLVSLEDDINTSDQDFIEFTVGGDDNRYYPVVLYPSDELRGVERISIVRDRYWEYPTNWDSYASLSGHLNAAITFTFDWSMNTQNANGSRYLEVVDYEVRYINSIIGIERSNGAVVVWLLGGGAKWRIYSPFGRKLNIDSGATNKTVNGSSFTAIPLSDDTSVIHHTYIPSSISYYWTREYKKPPTVNGLEVYYPGNSNFRNLETSFELIFQGANGSSGDDWVNLWSVNEQRGIPAKWGDISAANAAKITSTCSFLIGYSLTETGTIYYGQCHRNQSGAGHYVYSTARSLVNSGYTGTDLIVINSAENVRVEKHDSLNGKTVAWVREIYIIR